MGRPGGWAAAATGRPPMRSPGRPPVSRREHRQAFWEAIARGASSEDAGVEAGVSPAVGTRWFREAGGMPTSSFEPHSSRYLSFAEREEIAICRAYGCGGDRPAPGPVTVHDLAGAAPQRGDPGWTARLPGGHRAVASGPSNHSAEGSEAGRERAAARVRAGPPGRRDLHARWDTGARAGDAVERSPPRPPTGPALGQLVESRADRPSVAGGLPR